MTSSPIDDLAPLLFWPLRLLVAVTLTVVAVSVSLLLSGATQLLELVICSSLATLAFACSLLLLHRKHPTAAVSLTVLSALVLGAVVALRFPELRLVVAVHSALALLIVGAIGPIMLSQLLLLFTLLQLAILVLQPALRIEAFVLGDAAIVISLITMLPVVTTAAALVRQLVLRERHARRELAVALQQLEGLQARLVQTAQDRAVTDMAATATHELAQPLTILLNESDLLRQELPAHDPALEAVERLYLASVRATQILRRIGDVRRYVTTTYVPGTTMLHLDKASETEQEQQNGKLH